MAQSNADLTARTERQAGTLGEATEAMRELGVTAEQSANHAQLAAQLARCAANFAARGGSVVQRLVVTMASIQGSSRKVVEIVGVIDGLAFQTNLLALSAAMAAARAGAHNEGIAQVATDVLTLAQRSATAAHQIKALVAESVADIEGGNRSVAEAGENMAEIVASVREVGDVIGQISQTSAQQVNGLEGTRSAIVEVAQMTQQNLALVRQAAAAASSLQRQAINLSAAVAMFKLDEGSEPPAP